MDGGHRNRQPRALRRPVQRVGLGGETTVQPGGFGLLVYANPNPHANFRPYSDIVYTFPDTDTHRYADAKTASSTYPLTNTSIHPISPTGDSTAS